MRHINNQMNRSVVPSGEMEPDQLQWRRYKRDQDRALNPPKATGDVLAFGSDGATTSLGLSTSIFYYDLSSAVVETAISAAGSFTIGAVGSGEDIEVVWNTGPNAFEWSESGVSAGRVNLRIFIPGYPSFLPFASGAPAWSFDHSGTGDAMDTITVTKPAGAPIPKSLGNFLARIYVEIQQPG